MASDITELRIQFRDSLNYHTQTLAKWPETFGLNGIDKGIVPHEFHRTIYWERILSFPEPSEYGYESMASKDQAAFFKWYKYEKKAKPNSQFLGRNCYLLPDGCYSTQTVLSAVSCPFS